MNVYKFSTLIISFFWIIINPVTAEDCVAAGESFNQARNAKQINKRLAHLNTSIEHCPTFVAWYIKGRTYQEMEKLSLAGDAFLEAKKYADNDKSVAQSLGRAAEVMFSQNKSQSAMSLLRTAIRTHKPTPKWMSNLLAKLDNQSEGSVMSAENIANALDKADSEATKSFGVVPAIHLRVNFKYNSAILKGNGKQQVNELAKALTRLSNKGYQFRLVGHTDKRGSNSYNQSLSKKRAEKVRQVIGNKKSSLQSMICVEGKGESELLYEGNTENEHKRNRRVEVKLVKKCY